MKLVELLEDRQKGKSLEDQGYQYGYVTIYRAVPATVTTFKVDDYVTMSRKIAKEHADHVAEVEGESAHVIKMLAKAKDVYDAYNPGEYFYGGLEKEGKIVYSVQSSNLEEITKVNEENIIYYHGSRKSFPIDFVLTPQNDGYVFSIGDEDGVERVEKIIEQNRPRNMLSRFESVFMVDDINDIDSAGGYLAYIYEVEPIGKVEKNNLSWYSEISGFEDSAEELEMANKAAQNYWNGVKYLRNGLWEYRSKKAKIMRLIEHNKEEGF